MADFVGVLFAGDAQLKQGIEYTGRVDDAHQKAPQKKGDQTRLIVMAVQATAGTFQDSGAPAAPPVDSFVGNLADRCGPNFDWFEKFHVVRRRYDFGNVLATTSLPIEVYNAHRRDPSKEWLTFVNNAGEGLTLVGQPSLPVVVANQDGIGMQLQVTLSGPPIVDSTIVFTFSTPQTIIVPVTFLRVVLFAPEPELPYAEILEFETDVLVHSDGGEQRISPRKNPRQFFEWDFFLEDGQERSRLHNVIFDWQSRVFGVPVWHDMTFLTTPQNASDTVLNVQSTAFADYRDGGLVLVYETPSKFDVAEILSHTATTITLSSGLLNAYSAGRIVAPVRTAIAVGSISGTRFPSADARLRVTFRVKDNDAVIASTAAFPSFKGKVLFDRPNLTNGNFTEEFERELIVLDSVTGATSEVSPWDRSLRRQTLTTLPFGRQASWETRQLMHALRGRQTSFYLPTHSKDLEPTVDLASGSATMTVKNVGYAKFVRNRQTRDSIRVLLFDGTTILKSIIASSEISADLESLTVDSSWSSTIPVASIRRVEFVEEVRFDSDRIRIQHETSERTARFSAPVLAVRE